MTKICQLKNAECYKFEYFWLNVITLLFMCLLPAPCHAHEDNDLIKRVFGYKAAHIAEQKDTTGSAYIKYVLITERRNPTLMCIPTMFAVSRGNRCYIGESYNTMKFTDGEITDVKSILETGTIPHNREIMPTLVQLITPQIYDITIYQDHTISPLHRKNRLYYRYDVKHPSDSVSLIEFTPKIDNTQLVKGWAEVETATGRVIRMKVQGHYDMCKYSVDITMGKGEYSLCAASCRSNVTFSFLGNLIYTQHNAEYMLGDYTKFSFKHKNERAAMDSIRPVVLTDLESDIYLEYDSLEAKRKNAPKKDKKKEWHQKLWDSVGDKILSRHKLNFGEDDRATFRLSPVLNPLYLGYSERKGVTYKFNLRFNYVFSPKYDLYLRFKGGYSFKQHQFYFRVPIYFNYNKKHNGYVKLEVGNGNRIVNSEILDALHNPDSIKDVAKDMKHFRDFNVSLTNHYDFNDKIGF